MRIKAGILTLFTLLITLSSLGQTTVVFGTIKDSVGEPVPLAIVRFADSKISAQADFDGNYRIESYYATDSITVDMTGFARFAQKIEIGVEQEVNIILREPSAGSTLDEFQVTADKKVKEEDPAWAIWRQVIKYKDVNNREKLDAYEYETYNKVEFDLNNMSENFTESRMFKHFNFIFDHVDSTENKPYLPIFLTESISQYYYRKDPKSEKEYVEATRISGVKNNSVSQFMGDMYQNVNIYENNVSVFGKSFISPLSGMAKVYYDLYLRDSVWMDSSYCYKITFIPKRRQEPTFVGDMWVNDTTFAIKKITASLAKDANINFVDSLSVEQTYNQVQNEVWMLTKDKLFVDFSLTENSMGFYGRRMASYRNFIINEPKEKSFYLGGQNIFVADDVNDKSNEFWKEHRHDSLNQNEQFVFYMMDTLENIPQVQSYIDIITMIVGGYKVWGKVEIGPLNTLYSYNPVEGHRVRIGGRTSNAFSTRLELSGYGAFGFTDKEWKYGGGFRYMVSKKPRQVLSFKYKHDVEQLGQGQNALSDDNVLRTLFARNPITKLSFVDEFKLSYDHEWFPGFNSRIILNHRTLSPLGTLDYYKFGEAGQRIDIPQITTAEVTYFTRFAYDEKFVSGEFDRISLGTKYPILEAQYSYGIPDVLNSGYEYHKVVMGYNHWFPVGIFGWIRYKFQAGKIWGTLPYPLLAIHEGNETYYYDETSFNTMNFFEFISDEYVRAHVTHHLDGFFLNKIPLMRKLKWREVVSAKAVWGRLDPKHFEVMELQPNMFTLRHPFAEASIGIENIFKVLRVDFIWRLNYLDHPDIVKYGIRAKFDVQF